MNALSRATVPILFLSLIGCGFEAGVSPMRGIQQDPESVQLERAKRQEQVKKLELEERIETVEEITVEIQDARILLSQITQAANDGKIGRENAITIKAIGDAADANRIKMQEASAADNRSDEAFYRMRFKASMIELQAWATRCSSTAGCL